MIPSCHSNHPKEFIQQEINEHDRKLIEKANLLHYTDWMGVNEAEAETVDGFWELHHIASKLYHMEEASIGNI